MPEQMLVTPPVALVDILDRVLAKGAVVTGEIVIGIADIDLIRISLRLLLASVRAELTEAPAGGSAVGLAGGPAVGLAGGPAVGLAGGPVGVPAANAAVTW